MRVLIIDMPVTCLLLQLYWFITFTYAFQGWNKTMHVSATVILMRRLNILNKCCMLVYVSFGVYEAK